MQKQKPIIEQSLAERADEREQRDGWRTASSIASFLVSVGLVISALLTMIYLMLLVDDAAGLPSPYGLLFGLLVGIVAIVPAEIALVIWKTRLSNDAAITKEQRWTAVIAMVLAGIFSALTTSSFFSYFLPQLFPASYQAIAPSLNVSGIVGSWVVFLLAIVAYGIFSRQTQQNIKQADANQKVFDARMTVLKSAAEAINTAADNLVNDLEKKGVFAEDAWNLIMASLGMEDNRVERLGDGMGFPALPSSGQQNTATAVASHDANEPDTPQQPEARPYNPYRLEGRAANPFWQKRRNRE